MPDNNLTASQIADPVVTYLAEAEQRWDAAGNFRNSSYPTALEHLGKALRSLADIPLLLRAVRAGLAHHQDDSYGRCITCREFCTCVEDAYGALPSPVPQATGYAVMARAWENCPHDFEPFPCKERRDITAALTGENDA
jgi:hypothetical protein